MKKILLYIHPGALFALSDIWLAGTFGMLSLTDLYCSKSMLVPFAPEEAAYGKHVELYLKGWWSPLLAENCTPSLFLY